MAIIDEYRVGADREALTDWLDQPYGVAIRITDGGGKAGAAARAKSLTAEERRAIAKRAAAARWS